MPLPHAPDGLAHKFLSVTKIGLGLYLASYVVLPFILLAQAAVFGSFVFVYLWWILGQLGRAVSAAARRSASAAAFFAFATFSAFSCACLLYTSPSPRDVEGWRMPAYG